MEDFKSPTIITFFFKIMYLVSLLLFPYDFQKWEEGRLNTAGYHLVFNGPHPDAQLKITFPFTWAISCTLDTNSNLYSRKI